MRMVKKILVFLARFGGGGLVSYGTPKFLIAAGVPLDNWIQQAADKFTGASWINYNSIYWSLVVVIGIIVIYLSYFIPGLRQKKQNSPEPSAQSDFPMLSDLPIGGAIDYLVNSYFSNDIPNHRNHDTQTVPAIEMITTKLRSGELTAWGRYIKAAGTRFQTESAMREIKKEQWEYRELLPLASCVPSKKSPQTQTVRSDLKQDQFTDLHVNFRQVKNLWPGSTIQRGIRISNPICSKQDIKDEAAKIIIVRFKLENLGDSILKECLVKLNELSPMPPGMNETDLPIAVPTEGQTRGLRSGSFKLRPGEPKFLTLLRFAQGNPRNPISLIHEDGTIKLPRDQEYFFNIIAYCETGPPSQQKFYVSIDSDGDLNTENV